MARILKIATIFAASAMLGWAEEVDMEALASDDACLAAGGEAGCALNALQMRGAKIEAHDHEAAASKDDAEATEADAEKAAADGEWWRRERYEEPRDDQCGLASKCNYPEDCMEYMCCQRLANDGGHPLGGTTKCRGCKGAGRKQFKCQMWPGMGSKRTCGCTDE